MTDAVKVTGEVDIEVTFVISEYDAKTFFSKLTCVTIFSGTGKKLSSPDLYSSLCFSSTTCTTFSSTFLIISTLINNSFS